MTNPMYPSRVHLTRNQLSMFANRERHPDLVSGLIPIYGKVFQVFAGPISLGVVVADGTLIQAAQLTMDRGKVMQKGAGSLGPHSIMLMDNTPEHLALKKKMSHALAAKQYFDIVTAKLTAALERLTGMSEFNIVEETSAISKDIVLGTFFHETPLTPREQHVFVKLFEVIAKYAILRAYSPTPLIIPGNKWEWRARAIVRRIMRERMKRGDLGTDLMGMLLTGENGDPLEPKEAEDNIITAFIAGWETTSSMMGSLIQLMSQHPTIMGQIAAEVNGQSLTFEIVRSLKYTQRVVDEGLRVLGPSWEAYGATGKEEFILGDYVLPKEQTVFLLTWLGHNDETWGDPKVFRPDRFTEPHPPFIPFGAGPRVCAGKAIGEMELLILLVLLTHYRITVPTTYPRHFGGTLGVDPQTIAHIARIA